MNNPKIDELLKVLADHGMSPDDVTKVRDELLDRAYEAFMQNIASTLSDADLQKIEACATQEEANQALKDVYHEKTGKDTQEEMKKIVDQKADEFIARYQSDAASQAVADTAALDNAEIKKIENELSEPQNAKPPEDPTENPQTDAIVEPIASPDPVLSSDPNNWQQYPQLNVDR